MTHCGTQIIKTERLILRRFTAEDADAMYNNWASDPEVTKYLTWATHTGADVTSRVLSDWVSSYENDNFYQWAIALKDRVSDPIGSISAVRVEDSIGMVEIGYCIGKKWWHKGIMTEALNAVIDYFFNKVNANRVESRHDTKNPRSGMVMKKCGMKYLGTKLSADRNNQGICDICLYAVLREKRQT